MRAKLLLSIILITAAGTASAYGIRYDIGPMQIGNWSGSYIHKATSCGGGSDLDMNGDGGNDTLYMCGNARPVTGWLQGDWNGDTLTNITGEIRGSYKGFDIIGGSLGGAYYDSTSGDLEPRWYLETDRKGTFYFESLAINQISKETLTLWGQNLAAYFFCRACGERWDGESWGVDLYGAGTALPEPRTLGLIAFGLLSMPLVLARRSKPVPGRR